MRNSILLIGSAVVLGAVGYYFFQEGVVTDDPGRVAIDSDDIGGIVMGPDGPEAGVWVIAETDDLPTRFVRSVVTDDDGRYVIPDLPEATYLVWARGYGLLDSTKIEAAPGDQVHLASEIAPDEKSAADIYPAMYWGALLNVPSGDELPGTGDAGNGISPDVLSQEHWLDHLKSSGCYSCHQFGNSATRALPAIFAEYEDSFEAWAVRIQSGNDGLGMVERINEFGARRALEEYADWTDRIEAGELPFERPARPQGVERNVVVTQWDFTEPYDFLHDVISTDRRDPTVNGYGPIFGSTDVSTDLVPILDPINNTISAVEMPLADPDMPLAHDNPIISPSPYWGEEKFEPVTPAIITRCSIIGGAHGLACAIQTLRAQMIPLIRRETRSLR